MMKPKAWAVVLFFVSGFIGGVLTQVYSPVGRVTKLDLAVMLIGLGCIFCWFRFDSDERNYRRSPILSIMMIALAILAMPYYLFRTRGIGKGIVATLIFLCCMLAVGFVSWGGEWAAYFFRTH